jgi:hypothetical protein
MSVFEDFLELLLKLCDRLRGLGWLILLGGKTE